MNILHPHLQIFVATRRDQVPPGCVRYLSVDGSVPGATVTWDHHLTGEPINLDAMPDTFDATDMEGVGTTLADTDAVASVVAVLLGGKAMIAPPVRSVLASASYHCDHLRGHPDCSPEINELGRGLHGFVVARLRASLDAQDASTGFARICRALAECVASGSRLPFDVSLEESQRAKALELENAGRIRDADRVAVVDVRGHGPVDPGAVYARIRAPLSVFVEEHEQGGLRYTVGVNPFADARSGSIRPALAAIAKAEFAHGPPAVAQEPGPGSENWGGRDTVFGSPWNYGSRLSVDEVVALVAGACRHFW